MVHRAMSTVAKTLLLLICGGSLWTVVQAEVTAPTVSLAAPSSPLYAGTSLSLTCTVSAVDTNVTFNVTLERTRQTGPVSIENNMGTVANITVSTLDTGYTCRAVASTTQSTSPEGNDSHVVMVTAPPPPDVSAEFSGSPVAGAEYTLLCRATAPVLLASPPTVSVVGVPPSVTMTPTSAVSGSESTQSVLFLPLLTSHGGSYACQAGYNIPQANLPDLSTSTTANVVVQIPPPTVTINPPSVIVSPPSNAVFVGNTFALACLAQLGALVDVAVSVTVVWTGQGQFSTSQTSANLLAQDTSHSSSLTVNFATVANSGDYSCSIVLDSVSNFITMSSSVAGMRTVTVVPVPSVPVITDIPQINSILYTWSQAESDVVDRYTITLVYIGPSSSVTVEDITGSLGGEVRQFEGTDLISFSQYQFTLAAINRAGSSPAAVSTSSTLSSDACPLLTVPSNGGISYSEEARGMGTVATYTCTSGYMLAGETSRTCSSNNTWSGSNVASCVDTNNIMAEVVPPENAPTAGQGYSLTCTVSGADSLNPTISYHWTRGSTTVGTNSATLTFEPLVLSNAGQYKCEATLSSSFLSNPLTVASPSVELTIQVPLMIGFQTNESRLREGDTVEVCLAVSGGEVTSLISIAIFTGNTEGSILPDDAFAGRDYNTDPQTDLMLDEILLALSPGDQRVCFQVLAVSNSIPDSSTRQTTFRFRTDTTTITSPIPSHQLYILDDDVNCTQQVSVESRRCVDVKSLSVTCLEPALVCDYLVINCPDMSDELNCPSPLDGLVTSTVSEDNIGTTVSQVARYAAISANGTLLQTNNFLSDISTVFGNVANIVNSFDSTVNPTVVSEMVSTLDSLLRWNPNSLTVDSTSSLVQSFEAVASIFAQQANLTVNFMDVSFVSELASTDNLSVSGSSVDFGNQVSSPTSIVLPPSTFVSLPEDQSFVGVFFTLYQAPSLFPITSPPRADNTTTRMRAVGSVVVAATVGTGLTLINIDPPVLITVGLQNPENISQGSESCVSWDFNSQSWVTEGCSTMRVGNNVECRCDHLTNFAVLVDICSRAQDCVSDPTVDMALEGITLIGVVISCVCLIITIITLLAFRKLREKDNSKHHIQLSIAILCLLIVFAAGIGKVQVYGGCIIVSILIHYFSLAAIMWMGAEALLMFQKLAVVFVTITKRYIVILSLVCWLVPLIPVLIPMIVDLADGSTPETDLIITRNMDNETGIINGFCFLQHPGVFFGAFLGPIFAIILFNLVIFISVIVILIKHTRGQLKRSYQDVKPKTVIRLVITISGVMFLFGLTWLFGALTFSIAGNNVVRDIFRALFVIFASFQGFFIFLFLCVFNKEARESWKEVLSCGKYKSQFLHPSQCRPFRGVAANQDGQKATTIASLSLSRMTNQSDSLNNSNEAPVLSMKPDISKVQEKRYSHQITTPTSEVSETCVLFMDDNGDENKMVEGKKEMSSTIL